MGNNGVDFAVYSLSPMKIILNKHRETLIESETVQLIQLRLEQQLNILERTMSTIHRHWPM